MMTEIRDIRVLAQDLQMCGSAVTWGATYAARVYDPLAEALLNPKLFANVEGRLRVLDRVTLYRTNKGHRVEIAMEMVDLLVKGFDAKTPVLFQLGPVFRLQEGTQLTPQAPAAPADPRDSLKIEMRETSQGRGKAKLKSWDVLDGVGNLLSSFNDEEAANTFLRDFRKLKPGQSIRTSGL
jgi:hypothetical protein